MLLYILLGPLVKTTSWNEWRRCLSPFPLAEELSCAVSRRVLHVPVTALDRSSGSQHYANLWTVCGCVSVHVCMYVRTYACMCACCPQSTLLILLHSASDISSPRAVFTPSIYSQKNTLKAITSLFFLQFFTLYISPLFTPDFYWLVVWNQLHVR